YDHIKPRSNFQPESQKKSTPLKLVPQKFPHATPCFQFGTIPNSYAHAAANNLENTEPSLSFDEVPVVNLLCPISADRDCPYGDECEYRHGDVCDLCGLAVLLPGDEKQNLEHRQQHERDMELSFAIARIQDKQCGFCMDTVLKKQPTAEQRFGILFDCSHCFCFACIRKWKAPKQFDSKTIRSCPGCRVQSDFVTPSAYWVDRKKDKIKLIQGYKQALGKKPCNYFDQGRGECQFNEKCFYLHMNPDGTKAESKPRRRRQRRNADGSLDYEERVTFWDFFQERQERLQNLLLMLEDDI
ncbi:MKRN1-like protein, partial [Mya arenaria]